jgi:LPS-assembly protein
VPIFSTDSGMVFERDDSFLGNAYVQTLEPRMYYVYIPFREQTSDIYPNFDTVQAPFNFGQIFTENRFLGSDRIGDANMMTAAVTSRLIDNEGGTERLRITVGERFSFKAPQVNIVDPTDSTNRSDVLIGVGGRLTRAWSLDSLAQYNPNQGHTEAYNVMARYKLEAGKLLNLNYRFTRNTLRQADVSTQWPLFGHWQGVARMSYSLQSQRAVEALAGLEYNQACWAVRIGAQSFMTGTNQRSTPIFLQLELTDLVPIGSETLDNLRNSIPGYTNMNKLPAPQSVQGLH